MCNYIPQRNVEALTQHPNIRWNMSAIDLAIEVWAPVIFFVSCRGHPWFSDVRVKSLWPSGVMWRQGSRSTLVQVMACCLTAPSHYLNQCWRMWCHGVMWGGVMWCDVMWWFGDVMIWWYDVMKWCVWSVKCCGIQFIAISQKILEMFIVEMSLKFTHLRLFSNPQGTNELSPYRSSRPWVIFADRKKTLSFLPWWNEPEQEVFHYIRRAPHTSFRGIGDAEPSSNFLPITMTS